MKNALLVIAAVTVLISGVSLPEAKEKKPKKAAAKTEKSAPTATPAAPAVPTGWTEVPSSAPNLVKVSYKFDGHYINIKFQNLTSDRLVRIKYQAKWKKNVGGKWVDDASSEGLTIRLRKQEELTKDVLARSADIKDVVIDIEASEVL